MTKSKWINRIVGHDEVAPDQLLANPLNYRIHPAQQQSALSGSLDNLGWIQEVLVNKNTGHVIDGHLRIQLALRNDEKLIPVTYLDLTEDEEKLALLSLDTIAAMAAIDKEQLDNLLTQVNSDDTRIQEFLHNLAEENNLIDDEQGAMDAEPRIDKADELQEIWQVKPGDLYKIGDHRLLCGDATRREDVDKLMMGEKADMVFTDPPYGVNYEGGANNKIKRRGIIGDGSADLYIPALINCKYACKKGAPMYIWFTDSFVKFVYDAVDAINYEVRAMIIWNKIDAHYGGYMAQYLQKHEPCLYIVDGNPNFIGPPNEVTVWDVKQPSINEFHPTQKPIELAMRAISNHRADIVLDLFGGGGSTMIACQNEDRVCRMMEIDPRYCAVILQRMTDAFQDIIIEKLE